jgi:hypothetical protein
MEMNYVFKNINLVEKKSCLRTFYIIIVQNFRRFGQQIKKIYKSVYDFMFTVSQRSEDIKMEFNDQEQLECLILTAKEEEEYVALITKLRVIGSLKTGQKICVYGDTLVIDKSFVPYLSRWMNGQTAETTLNYINKVLIESKKYINYGEVRNLLLGVKYGLNNLRETYKNRMEIVERINIINDNITT